MKKRLAILLALLLCIHTCALADAAGAWLWKTELNEETLALLRSDAPDEAALVQLLGLVSVRAEQTDDLFRIDFLLSGESLAHLTFQQVEDSIGLTSNMFPNIRMQFPLPAASGGGETVTQALSAAAEAGQSAALNWAARLEPEENRGSYAGAAFEQGSYRVRYTLTDADLARLAEMMVNSAASQHLAAALLLDSEAGAELIESLRSMNLQAASSKRFTYVLDLVYQDSGRDLSGVSLHVLDGGAAAWSASLGETEADGEPRTVLTVSVPTQSGSLCAYALINEAECTADVELFSLPDGTSLWEARNRKTQQTRLAGSHFAWTLAGSTLTVTGDTTLYLADKTRRIQEEHTWSPDGVSLALRYGDSGAALLSMELRPAKPAGIQPDAWTKSYSVEDFGDDQTEASMALDQAITEGTSDMAFSLLRLLPADLVQRLLDQQ